MRKVAVRGLSLVCLVAYTAFLFWMATRPGRELLWLERYLDKVLHVGAFFVTGVIGVWAMGYPGLSPRKCARRGFWVVAYAFLTGGLIELAQRHVPGRSCERADLIADLVGTSAAVFLAVSILRRRERLRNASHS